jgi:hypothetical protein
MGLLAAGQAEMAEAVASWSRLRSRIAMIDSLALAQEVPPQNNEYPRFYTCGVAQGWQSTLDWAVGSSEHRTSWNNRPL